MNEPENEQPEVCEGCGALASEYDNEGIPLCAECAALPADGELAAADDLAAASPQRMVSPFVGLIEALERKAAEARSLGIQSPVGPESAWYVREAAFLEAAEMARKGANAQDQVRLESGAPQQNKL